MLLTVYLLLIGLHVSEGCTLENREQTLPITAHTGGSVLLPCSCTDVQTKPEEFSWKKDHRNTQEREEISRESDQYRNRVQLYNDSSPGNLSLLISHLTEEDEGVYWCAVKDSHIIIRLTVEEGPPATTATPTTPTIKASTKLTTKASTTTTPKTTTPTTTTPKTTPTTTPTTTPKTTPTTTPPPPPTTTSTRSTEKAKELTPPAPTSPPVDNSNTSPNNSTPSPSPKPRDTDQSIHFFILIPVLLLLLGLGGVLYWRYRGRRRGQTESQEQRSLNKDEPKTQDEVTYSTVVHSSTPATDEVTYSTVVHSSRPGTTPTVTDIGDKSEYATIQLNI